VNSYWTLMPEASGWHFVMRFEGIEAGEAPIMVAVDVDYSDLSAWDGENWVPCREFIGPWFKIAEPPPAPEAPPKPVDITRWHKRVEPLTPGIWRWRATWGTGNEIPNGILTITEHDEYPANNQAEYALCSPLPPQAKEQDEP
jgi:hypothetical protein